MARRSGQRGSPPPGYSYPGGLLHAPPPSRVRRGRWTRFVRTYGWRAYALPLLVVVTVAALLRPDSGAPAAAAESSSHASVQIEGRTHADAGYAVGSTPSPVVINLGSDVTSCASNTYAQLVLVSISQQHLWACQGSTQVNSSPITTGKVTDDDQTPLGSWRVQDKQRDRYLVGPGYRDYVHDWVPFNGDFGLHDASWQTMPFGSADWRTEGSHGCVHTPTTVMAWLYQWVQVGSTVVTIES